MRHHAKLSLLVAGLSVVLSACNGSTPCAQPPPGGSAPELYFGSGFLPDDPESIARKTGFVRFLQAMAEPSLSRGSRGASYRLLMWRSTRPLYGLTVVRVELVNGVVMSRLARRGEDSVSSCAAHEISLDEWREIDDCFNRSGYWMATSRVQQGVIMDGSGWVLEAARPGQYHAVIADPETDIDPAVRRCGLLLERHARDL